MIPRTIRLIAFATLACLLLGSGASAQISVAEQSQELALAATQGFGSKADVQESIFISNSFAERSRAKRLANTNWKLDTTLLLYDIDYGTVNFQNIEGEDDLASGMRFMFGWESDSGYGIRMALSAVRAEGSTDLIAGNYSTPGDLTTLEGFHFRGASPFAGAVTEITAATSNIDIYKRAQSERFDLLFGVGLSGAGLSFDVPTEGIENSVSGGGISIFSAGKYSLMRSDVSEVSLVANTRVAFLDGEWESLVNNSFGQMDSGLNVAEWGVGMEWRRQLGRAALTLSALYEQQIWDSDVTNNVVLNGAAIRAGVAW